MREFWRPLMLAAVLTVSAVVGVATAQTVIVTKAPPGAAIELGFNADTVGTATADAAGIATLPVNLSSHGGKKETDARIFVDVCEKARRVTLVESGWQPPAPASGCTRREIFGVFFLRDITTLVVNAAEQSQAVWIKQGPAPPNWLSDEPAGGSAKTGSAFVLPTGLVLFGGGGVAKYSDAVSVSCGTEPDCAGKDVRLAGRVGGDYWFAPFLAVSATYLKPASALTAGVGTDYHFDSAFTPQIVTIAGKVGIPIGRARIYGEAGANHSWATLSTTQTINDRTITVAGVTQTVTGGTQTFELKTAGWGWMFGGGLELWLKRSLGIYAEFGYARLKGSPTGGGEGALDEKVTYAVAGVRVRLAGRR
jgi:hypothetical protein